MGALRLLCREIPMKTPGCSAVSKLSSLQLQDAAPLLRFAFLVAVACGLIACSREATPPAASEAQRQSAVAATSAPPVVHPGATGHEHGQWATAGDSVPEQLREPCSRVNNLVRSVAGSAPPSTKISELSGPRPIMFKYQFAKAESAGCEFVVRGSDSVQSSSSLFVEMDKAFKGVGWTSIDDAYSADGTDGSDDGYSRDGLLCAIEGRWDGGDDSDPTVIPSPDFDVFVTCAPQRADDHPPS